MDLAAAITAAEQSLSDLSSAKATTDNDNQAVQQAQAKLDAANQKLTGDLTAQLTATVAANTALKALSDAALAAMIPVDQGQPAAPQVPAVIQNQPA